MCRPWILFCRSPALTLAFLTIDSSLLYESQNLATVCTDRAILAVYRRGTRGEETDFRTEDLGLTGKDAPGRKESPFPSPLVARPKPEGDIMPTMI